VPGVDARFLRQRQHQADAAAVEECHRRRRLEEEPQAEDVAVERDRPGQVADRHRDLADARDADSVTHFRHGRLRVII
jgi:hypothetical protein